MDSKVRFTRKILKTKVDAISLDEATTKIVNWAAKHKSKYISITNTHVVTKAWIDRKFREIINSSDLSTPDGAPLSFLLRLNGYKNQKRVTGPDLMEKLIIESSKHKLKLFFYASTREVLNLIKERIKESNLDSDIYYKSPPFRNLTNTEEDEIIEMLKKIKPNIIFVGLGCPKQDLWIQKNKKKINSVFISVGAAFEFYAKTLKRAPKFMRDNGLEWIYRLYKEPLRLYKRYLSIIFIFGIGLIVQYFLNLFKKYR